ncbi:hypothetical protein D9615_010470 [Tricholomella constricta]|uniref:Uncharacterized protein n=1 Tax=Tricholomella constricta TaxID=117010 RepID=A0A8H5LSK9_9AGAR|nr:hypothetical protein D9615_010470 [Tricholomella constricta]
MYLIFSGDTRFTSTASPTPSTSQPCTLSLASPHLKSSESGVLVTATIHDYDFSDTSKVVALVIQALMGFKHLYDAKLVSIHLLAKPTEVGLKRPFKAVSAHPTDAVSLSPSSSRTYRPRL